MKDIFNIIVYTLLIILFSLGIIKLTLTVYDRAQCIYCNYAIENGNYQDNTTGRFQCTVDFLDKFIIGGFDV